MNDDVVKERKVEKQLIVDEKEEWPTDMPANYTEVIKIEETSRQDSSKHPNGSSHLIEKIDSFLDKIEHADARKDLNEIKRLLTDTLLNIQINDEKLEALKKRLGSIDGINLAVDEIKDLFERKTSSIEGRLARHEERTSEGMLVLADEMRKKLHYSVEQQLNVEKNLNEISGMIDKGGTEAIRREIDLLGTMINEKVSDIESRIDGINTGIESIKKIKESVEAAGSSLASSTAKFDDYHERLGLLSESIESKFNVISLSSKEIEAARKDLVRSSTEIMETVSDEMRRADKRNAKAASALQRHASLLAKKSMDAKRLEKEVIKMNMRFAKLDEIGILMKIIEIRKALKKRKLPAWAKQRRDYIEVTLRALETEAIDIAVARELRGKMTLAEIRKATGYPAAKLKARLAALAKENIVKAERNGKRVLFFILA